MQNIFIEASAKQREAISSPVRSSCLRNFTFFSFFYFLFFFSSFGSLFETEPYVSLEKPDSSAAGVCFLSQKLRGDTHFLCGRLFRATTNAALIDSGTRTCKLCVRREGKKARATAGPPVSAAGREECEVVLALRQLATLNLLTWTTHTHSVDTHARTCTE